MSNSRKELETVLWAGADVLRVYVRTPEEISDFPG